MNDDNASRELWLQWNKSRVEEIHRRVTVYDVLQRNGVTLRTQDGEEQISCPFHGQDKNPSARVYPSGDNSHSHVWCFACNEQWDCIALWKKFSGQEDAKFSSILREIEQNFGITPPEMPTSLAKGTSSTYNENAKVEYERLLMACENRLRTCKKAFDMMGFMKVGITLDRLMHSVISKDLTYEQAKGVLRQVLDKIQEKESHFDEKVDE